MQTYYPLFTAIPLAAAFLNLLLSKITMKVSDYLAFLVTAILGVMSVKMLFEAPFIYAVGNWKPPFGILLVSDGLSSMMLVVINVIGFLAVVFSMKYMSTYTAKPKYFSLFLLMIAGMNGVVITGDMFNLYVFLEIASIASYALVGFGTGKRELEASFKYLILGGVASTAVLFGIAFLYSITGTLNMPDLAQQLEVIGMTRLVGFVIALFIMGFGLKASAVPFHAWLPDAHPSAPAPISAMLSGVLIKALGVYTIMRIMFNIIGKNELTSAILMFLGALSMVIGGLLAIGQKDFKRMLAYSSISQMGYVLIAIGLALKPDAEQVVAMLALIGGLFHLVNHAVFKSLLFLASGAVEYRTGTRDLGQLGGLIKKMPVTGAATAIGSLSIAGIPPFNGFWSKLIIILALFRGGYWIYGSVGVVVGFITLIYFVMLQKESLFGKLPESLSKVKEAPFAMVLPLVILAALCVAMGISYMAIEGQLLESAANALLDKMAYMNYLIGG
jgi:multicomponent Na+:H+ antiporter subunit D